MARVKRASKRRERRKKILGKASGFFGGKGRLHRIAKLAVERSLQNAYRDRRAKKRDFRRLWIVRINAACRDNGITYSGLIHGLKLAGLEMDRKVLADIAVTDPQGFQKLAERAKASAGGA